ncbi:uncharacterized protein F5Z01DRAFT_328397 [Emericellopsis atlantica]|uniref:Uncharacterized protein n=1 Tax=Emericellopsis atlantica TaxID=2614577 RepID=A0A9P8CL32_9HYPO|nr:uncharacterized protein F5Z01DRAFT_328397 [Emericellopsis atlantica]KAG9250978.1 hypothetical protein F5Z01DRAFT_328397 [Emericellopsis atlantica]
MANLAKTIVATGVSSGLGFEAMRQLLEQSQPYNIILGARNTQRAKEAYDALKYDRDANPVTILPLEMNDLGKVQSFASQVQQHLQGTKLDYVLLNAGITGSAAAGPTGSKWCEPFIVNHLSHHYLMHLLKSKISESKSRVVFVSSGAVRMVPDEYIPKLEESVKAGADTDGRLVYAITKFIGLLGAHWWRRELGDKATVVAVSPGLIPATGIARGYDLKLNHNSPDAKSPAEGGANVLRAMERNDLPEDPEQIFLTSWGEWWPKDVYGQSLDKKLQDQFCPSKEQIEKEEGLAA